MHYFTISFTHKNSTLAIREKLAYSEDSQKYACLEQLQSHPSINETVLISTCNRMEIICVCTSIQDANDHIFKHLGKRSSISTAELRSRADIFDDYSAIHHLFTVVSSLDSMVVGETQIAGQMKDACRFSYENDFCGHDLSKAMKYAFKCAAEIRNVTDISSKPVSIASVAVAKAKQEAGDLSGKKALIIGSGEMSVIAAKNLKNHHGVDVTMMNRTRAKAEAIAEDVGVEVEDFERLHQVLDDFDLLFTATGSQQPIIRENDMTFSFKKRYWFDMAVPRDIEAFSHESIALFHVDDLKTIVDGNIMLREDEAKASYAIVGRYTKEFFEWLKTLAIEPLIKEIYLRASNAAVVETKRAIGNGYIPAEYEAQATKMCEQAMKRFLHGKTTRLRDLKEQDNVDNLLKSLKFMLGVESDEYKTIMNK